MRACLITRTIKILPKTNAFFNVLKHKLSPPILQFVQLAPILALNVTTFQQTAHLAQTDIRFPLIINVQLPQR